MPTSANEAELLHAIRARSDALLSDLRLHVGLPTGGRHTQGLDQSRALLTARAARLGATVRTVDGSPRPTWLYGDHEQSLPVPALPTAICRRAGHGREILLCGHLDTVHDPASSFRELTLSNDGQRATGPGCVDMKGGLVIALAALEALESCGHRLAWTLLLNSDEETGSYHSFKAIYDEAARVHAAGGIGIAVEPATEAGALVTQRAGSGQFIVEVQGRAAHVGRDFSKGVSAVTALAEVVLEIAKLSNEAQEVVVNIGPMQGGKATNVVPDHAAAWGNVRFPTPKIAEDLQRTLEGLSGTRSSGAKVKLTTSFHRPAKPETPEVLAFAKFVGVAAADLGQPLSFAKTAGVCDGNIMQSAGLPTLDTLGVRGGGLHTPDEWIEIASLVERCQLLALTMLRLSQSQNLGF